MTEASGNRVGGGEVAAQGQGRFEPRAPLGEADLGSWPRSDAGDVAAALEVLTGADGTGPPDAAAFDRAASAAEALGAAGEATAWMARRLGVSAEELEPHHRDLGARVRRSLERALAVEAQAEAGSGRVSLILPDWTELYAGTATAVLAELLGDRSVLLLADERIPRLADALADAVVDAGFPGQRLAVLHGAGGEALRAAVRAPEVARVVLSGPPSRLEAVHQAAAARGPNEPLEILADTPAGRGVTLGADADPELEAERVVHAAFGRSETLSGQLPGRVDRVHSDPRILSAFTAALLDRLRGSPLSSHPVPLIDRAARDALLEARGLGLDAGATLIFGGAPLAHARQLALGPMVFTNVLEDSELLTVHAPGPLLRLLRLPR